MGCFPARALLELDLWEEAERIAVEAGRLGSDDDFVTQSESRQVVALADARRGDLVAAERLAREAVALTDPTDYFSTRGEAHVTLARVLDACGRREEGRAATREALALFERKANRAAVERARRLHPDLL